MLLSPEKSMEIQNAIGADIMMQLDDVISSLTTGPRVEEAMYRSIRWLDRCIKAHKRPKEQNLFPIIQGGLDPKLREICCKGSQILGIVRQSLNYIRQLHGHCLTRSGNFLTKKLKVIQSERRKVEDYCFVGPNCIDVRRNIQAPTPPLHYDITTASIP